MKDQEAWRPIPGFDDYDASSLGRIRRRKGTSPKTGRDHLILKQSMQAWRGKRGGYLVIALEYNGVRRNSAVHRWVLMAFTGGAPEGKCAAHKNGDRTDNRIQNLYWATWKENTHDKKKHGRWQIGDKAANRKLTEKQVLEIRASKLHARDIAKKYGIAEGYVWHLRSGKSRGWKWLTANNHKSPTNGGEG